MRLLILISLVTLILACGGTKEATTDQIAKIERSKIILEDGYIMDVTADDSTKVIFLVRHAEKDTAVKQNPVLTEQGVARANKLENIFKGTRLDRVYSTMYTRTLFTAQPTSESKGLDVTPYDAQGLRELMNKIMASDDQYNLVVGHSNTTPALINELCGTDLKNIDESVYDDLFIVVHDGATGVLYSLKY